MWSGGLNLSCGSCLQLKVACRPWDDEGLHLVGSGQCEAPDGHKMAEMECHPHNCSPS